MINLGQAELLFMRGERHYVAGKYDEALEDFNKVLEFVKTGGVEKSDRLAEAAFRAVVQTYERRDQRGDKDRALACLNEGIEFLSE